MTFFKHLNENLDISNITFKGQKILGPMDKLSQQIIQEKSLNSAKKEMIAAFVSGILVASFTYLFSNVFLNEILEALAISDLSIEQVREFRQNYELNKTQVFTIGISFSILSGLLSLYRYYKLKI